MELRIEIGAGGNWISPRIPKAEIECYECSAFDSMPSATVETLQIDSPETLQQYLMLTTDLSITQGKTHFNVLIHRIDRPLRDMKNTSYQRMYSTAQLAYINMPMKYFWLHQARDIWGMFLAGERRQLETEALEGLKLLLSNDDGFIDWYNTHEKAVEFLNGYQIFFDTSDPVQKKHMEFIKHVLQTQLS